MSKSDNKREQAILGHMNTLGITRVEAEELWAFDNDEADNAFVDAIEEQAREEQEAKPKGDSLAKVKTMKAKRKIDAEKDEIIKSVFESAKGHAGIKSHCEMGANKISVEGESGTYYSITITKHKGKPDGYKS